jgi:hypothetical protein
MIHTLELEAFHPFTSVMEVYVSGIEITDSLMRPLIVPVMNETSMAGKHPRLADVRLMERLNLTDRRWPPHACDDMLNPVSTAELRELRHASSCRIELGASIRQDLIRLPIFLHGFFQKLDRMLRGWVVMNPRAWNEAAVIVQVTDHPLVVFCEFEVTLPEFVAS